MLGADERGNPSGRGRGQWWLSVLLAVAIVGFACLVVYTAWLSDDAYITFRTIDNWRNGFGLRWNVVERVQTYTHPLWMFLLAGAWAVTSEPYFSSLALSLICSLAAVVIVARRLAPTPVTGILAVVLLGVSRAFVDFSTSGLENPLAHLLLAVFLALYWSSDASRRRALAISVVAALALCTRLDFVPLLAPALLLFASRARRGDWVALAAGMLPLVAWEAFSIAYYGFALPNTAYAKLPSNVTVAELVPHGVRYIIDSAAADPVVVATIAVSIVLALRRGAEAEDRALALGVLLYIAYLLRIGGDFMSGRFLTMPYLVAVVMVVRKCGRRWPSPAFVAALALVLVGGVTALPASVGRAAGRDRRTLINGAGIADERAFYCEETGLMTAIALRSTPIPAWQREGRLWREAHTLSAVGMSVGFFGYGAGPGVFVVDQLGLGDPLLARLPALPRWRIGHYARPIPSGYLETIQSGEIRIANPRIADYYRALTLITRGPIWSAARWRAILAFNLGRYPAPPALPGD